MTTEATTALTPPAIGQHWTGQGGVYMGTMPAIGDLPARHLIFGAESPQRLAWGPYDTLVDGANSRTDGRTNTAAILAHKAAHGGEFPAAEWAAAYTADGHADFHLPSQADLFFASLQPDDPFAKKWHWSSTQDGSYGAFYQSFEDGRSGWFNEGLELLVRPVRWIQL